MMHMNTIRRVTIFGANGNVGKLLVEFALARGYLVTAAVYGPQQLEEDPNLTIVHTDIYKPDHVARALKDADAVLSALGSWGTPREDVLSSAMDTIIPEMRRNGIRRVVSLTGADARAPGDHLSLSHRLTHALFSLFAGKVLRDGEDHISLLVASGLDWTVVRSPVMASRRRLDYKLTSSRPLPWQTISRQAVARAMVEQLSDATHLQQAPYLKRVIVSD